MGLQKDMSSLGICLSIRMGIMILLLMVQKSQATTWDVPETL